MGEFPGFIGPTYQSRSLIADAEQCVNLYPEAIESGAGKNRMALYGTPGLYQLGYNPGSGTYTTLPGAIMAMKSLWNASAGRQETYILTTGLETNSSARTIHLYYLTNLGQVAAATLPSPGANAYLGAPPQAAFLASNGKQLLIALKMSDYDTSTAPFSITSSLLYVYDLAGGSFVLQQVTSWDKTQPITGLDFLDGYFIISTTQSLYASAAGDGTNWSALNYVNISDVPDGITGLICDHRLVWIFGKSRTEAYYNAGGSDFPFQRVPQGVIETGCSAAGSIVAAGESIFWLGSGRQGGPAVYRNNGYNPVRVSNHYVERYLEQYAKSADQVNPAGLSGYAGGGNVNAAWAGVRAYAYRESGHLFYVLNFGGNNPAANAAYNYYNFPYSSAGDPETTLVYDATTNCWHERRFSPDGFVLVRHLGHFYVYDQNGQGHVLSDYRSGALYAMSPQTFTDAGKAITRWRTAPHLSIENKRNFYSQFTLDCEVGTEGTIAPYNPSQTQTLTLQWSDDGGQTWSAPRPLVVGQSGNYKARAIWRRLGKSRDRVFKVSTSDAMQVAWINAYLEFTGGAS